MWAVFVGVFFASSSHRWEPIDRKIQGIDRKVVQGHDDEGIDNESPPRQEAKTASLPHSHLPRQSIPHTPPSQNI